MKKTILISLTILLIAAGTWLLLGHVKSEWSGVDESVVEKFAEEAGREARDPYINTDQGDLLLFVFLLAGMVGGFVAGYYFKELFAERGQVQH